MMFQNLLSTGGEATESEGGTGDGPQSPSRPNIGTGSTVLLADDDDDFRETLGLWLATDDRWAVREASDGEEAIDELDETVDVLVLDRQMPNLSGPEVVDRLPETEFDGSVVVLSACKPDGYLNEGDVATYLTKPLRREEFVGHLRRILR